MRGIAVTACKILNINRLFSCELSNKMARVSFKVWGKGMKTCKEAPMELLPV